MDIDIIEFLAAVSLTVATICFVAFLAFMMKRDKRMITLIESIGRTTSQSTANTSAISTQPKLVMCPKCQKPFDMKNAIPVIDTSANPPKTRHASPCCQEMIPEGI